MRYQPETPPLNADSTQLIEYLMREFSKIAATLDYPQITALNYGKEVINTASDSTTTINWKAGQKQQVALGSSTTFTFNPPEGVCNVMLKLVYNGSYTPTFPSTVKWQGGTAPTWSASNGKVDVITMYYDGTNFHATASLDSK